MPGHNNSHLILPAIEYRQGRNRLYTFVINGKQVPLFATISRLKRVDGDKLIGYQRPQVISHIAEIKKYLESKDAMIPNAIVVAFDSRLKFQPFKRSTSAVDGTLGNLAIPTVAGVDHDVQRSAPGWIVDGQQRMAAIQNSVRKSFPMCVVAFIADDESTQREQFIRVNSAKPLPKDLIDELITETDAILDAAKEKRRFPLLIRNRLNFDSDSPFRGRIKTQTSPNGVIASSSVFKMIDHSLSNGVLFRHSRLRNGNEDIEAMVSILKHFWKAVVVTFPEAWNNPPSKSRLTHGAGIIGLGFVMDAICDRFPKIRILEVEQFARELQRIKPYCAWTTGQWRFGKGSSRKWNEIQNVPTDIQILVNFLRNCYMRRMQ